jgi:hypothetical protein
MEGVLLLKESPENRNKKSLGAFFQPKLTVNHPNDHYEQEADAMADKVMRMTDTAANQHAFFKPADNTIQRKCQACEEEDKFVHRKEGEGGEAHGGNELDNYVGSLNSVGQSMPDSSRKFFEPRFGHDFSNVKIHTDSVAAKSAQAINALAYTSGNNIVFNSGQYSPESDGGKKLMAHELTHVVQQSGGGSTKVQRKIEVPAGTELDTMGFNNSKSGNVYTCPKVTKTSVNNEIFTAMLISPRTFKLAGKTSAEVNQNLQKHIAARIGIIDFASKKKYSFGAGSAFKMNPKFWNQDATVKPGVNEKDAINDLNVNPKEYSIACLAATQLTMQGGSNSALQDGTSGDITDWIPGDWGYIENTNFAASNIPGLEGENLIYVGKDKFWGHFNPGNTYDTLDGWVKEVNSFDHNKGKALILSQRTIPTAGLQ